MSVGATRARLGADLWALVQGLGAPLLSASVLTSLPSPLRSHASFRLRFGDGRILKGRRVETSAQAERMEALVSRLDRRHFPRVIARRGAAVLEEWVEGRRVTSRRPGTRVLRSAGEILGAVHALDVPAGDGVPSPRRRLEIVAEQSAALRAEGAITADALDRVVEVAHAWVPGEATRGVIHRDFCAENLVRSAAGRLRAIDNETVQPGVHDFDLARTWYRWPMTPAEQAAFLGGYRRHRDPAAYLSHAPFWIVAVLVDTALFRIRAGTAEPDKPLRRLSRFLEALPRPGVPARSRRDDSRSKARAPRPRRERASRRA